MVALVVVAAVAVVTVLVVTASDSSSPKKASGSATGPAGGTTVAAGAGSAEVGSVAPDFALPPIAKGEIIRLSRYRGRPVVVNYWASWCHPCRKEFPLLKMARARYRDDGLEVIGVSYRDIASDARAFAESQRATWPLARDPDGTVAAVYGVRAVPQTFFIAPDGTIVSHVFGITSAADLDAEIAKILSKKR